MPRQVNDSMPAPLTTGHLCPDCNGTGADRARTLAARRRGSCDRGSYVRCWTCNGNGLDPTAYFRLSNQGQTATG